MTLRRVWIWTYVVLTLLAGTVPSAAQDAVAHVFWREGCPHCTNAQEALAQIAQEGGVVLDLIEVGVSDADDALFVAVLERLGIAQGAVPLVTVGIDYALGYASGGYSTGEYRRMIDRCRGAPCRDVVEELRTDLAALAAGQSPAPSPAAPSDPVGIGGSITVPLFGTLELATLSLPLLTLVLAGIDGFNPCAMWVLALLIGLLLGVAEPRRMWILGGVFLLATGAMYFAVMAAWLNVVLWLGAVGWIRLAIGALAIAAGFWYLREYWTNPEGICRVTPSGRRKSIADAFRNLVEQPSLLLAAVGVAALAIAVNVVELACSAGLPAIYTQALAMHDLPTSAYYAYLAAYIAVFLLDDTILFVAAMITLRAASSTGRYARAAHLIGGVVLLALGTVMVLRPDLLG